MPQAGNDEEIAAESTLRQFISALEQWPEHRPPQPQEYRELKAQFPLDEARREKLALLAENHVRRARTAQKAGSYDQAAAELSRAAQLRPMDPRPRVELADVYLQRSLERGYERKDRQKALSMARAALTLHPGNREARDFLKSYRRMNTDFRFAKIRRYSLPLLVLILAISILAWWRREWILSVIDPPPLPPLQRSFLPRRPVQQREIPAGFTSQANSGAFPGGEILTSEVGRKNGLSYLKVLGRVQAGASGIQDMELSLIGRGREEEILFTLPVTVHHESQAPLIAGDSLSFHIFHWLNSDETQVEQLEVIPSDWNPYESQILRSESLPLLWETPPPEGAMLDAQIRQQEWIEAYDRQVLVVDVSISNLGTRPLESLNVQLGFEGLEEGSITHLIAPEDAPLERQERRVWRSLISQPLDANRDLLNLVLRVQSADVLSSWDEFSNPSSP